MNADFSKNSLRITTMILLEKQLNSVKFPSEILSKIVGAKLICQIWRFHEGFGPIVFEKTDVVSGQCLSQVVIATFLRVQSTVIRFFQTWLALNHDFKVKFCQQNCNSSSSLGPWIFNYQNCETGILLAIKLKKMHWGVRTFVWQQININCKIG